MQNQIEPLPANPTLNDFLISLRSSVTPYVIVGSILSFIFFPPLIVAMLNAVKQRPVSLKIAFHESKPVYWRLLGLLICMAFLIGAGLAFFALPGILLLRRFVLAPYFLVQNNLGILESLRLASKRTAPYAWSLYSVFGIILLFSI